MLTLPKYFGQFGGQYVPETLVPALEEFEQAFLQSCDDQEFKQELSKYLKDFVGRPTPLYLAKNLSEHYQRKIYLKREDLCHTGAHKINNSIAQALLAKRLGKNQIVAETGAGQHGVATATACALLGMECKVFMGKLDVQRQAPNVKRMQLMGAEVIPVESGTMTLKDATSEAIRYWVTNVENSHYIIGSTVGPHPYPTIVREFQKIIGEETKEQMMSTEGKLPDYVMACIGGGSNAMGIFFPFIEEVKQGKVKLIGVEAAGEGVGTDKSAASMSSGRPGVLHGSKSYLLQDEYGQIEEAHSVSAGLDYPGVGPEHSYFKDEAIAEYVAVTDDDALKAFHQICKLEGIIPALETAHAFAYLERFCPQIDKDAITVINCSGRGDKDLNTIMDLNKS